MGETSWTAVTPSDPKSYKKREKELRKQQTAENSENQKKYTEAYQNGTVSLKDIPEEYRKTAISAARGAKQSKDLGNAALDFLGDMLSGGAYTRQRALDEQHRDFDNKALVDKAKADAQEAAGQGNYNDILKPNLGDRIDLGDRGQGTGDSAAMPQTPAQTGQAVQVPAIPQGQGAAMPGAAQAAVQQARTAGEQGGYQPGTQSLTPITTASAEAIEQAVASPGTNTQDAINNYRTNPGGVVDSISKMVEKPEFKRGLVEAGRKAADSGDISHWDNYRNEYNEAHKNEPGFVPIKERTLEELAELKSPPPPAEQPPAGPPPSPPARTEQLDYPIDESLARARHIPVLKYAGRDNTRALAVAQGIELAHYNAAREQMLGALGQKINNMEFELRLEANQYAVSYANLPTRQQEAKMTELFNKWLTNPAYSPKAPGISGEEARARYQALNKTMQSFRAQIQQNAFKVQESEAMVSLENNTAKIVDDVSNNRYSDTRQALADMKLQLNNARQFLTPQQYNKAFIGSIGAVGQAQIQADIKQRIEKSGGMPIADVAGLSSRYAQTLTSLYGYVAGELGEAGADVFRIEAVGQAEAAQKALQEHNLGYFQGKQDEYEWNMTQGNYDKAAAIAAGYAGRFRAGVSAGDISAEGMHKGRDWFKPVVGTGNKEKALNIEGAVTRRIESFRNYYDGVGGMSAAEVIADVYDEVAPALAKQGWNDAQIYQTITRQFAEALSKQSDKTGMKSDELINKFNDTETQFSNLAKAIAQRRQADNRNAPDEAAVKDAQKNINGWYHAAVIDILVTAKDGKDANDKIDVLSQEYLLKNIEIFDGANDINDESGGSVKALTGFYAKASAMEKETGIDPRSIAAKSGAADATQKMRDSKAAAMFERKFGEGSVRDIRSLNGMQIVTTMEGKQYELRPNKTGNDLEIYEVRVSSHPDGRRIENDAQVRDSYGRIITLGNRR